MSGEAAQTGEVEHADVEMSDSGYADSKESATGATSDIHSQSGKSTATLCSEAQSFHSQSHERVDSGVNSMSRDGSQTQFPGSQTHTTEQSAHLSQATLPKETVDQTSRTEKFEVFVKNLDGKPYTIEVDRYEEVSKFRTKVCEKLGVPREQNRLTSQAGRTLEDGRSLCDYDIKKHSTIYCQGRLRGGHTK